MTSKRIQELEDLGLQVQRIKNKLAEITKAEQEYVDSIDDDDSDEKYFERQFAEVTVDILQQAFSCCDMLCDKMDEAKG